MISSPTQLFGVSSLLPCNSRLFVLLLYYLFYQLQYACLHFPLSRSLFPRQIYLLKNTYVFFLFSQLCVYPDLCPCAILTSEFHDYWHVPLFPLPQLHRIPYNLTALACTHAFKKILHALYIIFTLLVLRIKNHYYLSCLPLDHLCSLSPY